MKQRAFIFEAYANGDALPQSYQVYRKPAERLSSIPTPCQMYISSGCAFVLNVAIVGKSKKEWSNYINASKANIRNNYIQPLNDTINYVGYYAGDGFQTFLGCFDHK